MISSLTLKNFKCFRNLAVDLKPLTLLAGLNGTGKSSVIQSLLLLRQSHMSGDLGLGRFLLGGELADLGTGGDLLFEDAELDEIGIGLSWPAASGTNVPRFDFVFLYDKKNDRLKLDVRPSRETLKRQPFLGRCAYVQADRLGPRKTLPLAESRARDADMGARGEYVFNVLLEHGMTYLPTDDPRIRPGFPTHVLGQVDAWLQEISPGSHLKIEEIRRADAALGAFTFDRSGDVATRPFRATNVGFGLSYALPVIVALLVTPPEGLVLLENPEAHVHPRGQTRLGQLAARTARAGVQVILESHSDHVMNGVRIDIREGILSPTDAVFHYFSRAGSESVVSSPQLDSDGRLSDWPDGFFDQHDENLAELLAPKHA